MPDIAWVEAPGTREVMDSGRCPAGFVGFKLGDGLERDLVPGRPGLPGRGLPAVRLSGDRGPVSAAPPMATGSPGNGAISGSIFGSKAFSQATQAAAA